jgi:hypothetical protein
MYNNNTLTTDVFSSFLTRQHDWLHGRTLSKVSLPLPTLQHFICSILHVTLDEMVEPISSIQEWHINWQMKISSMICFLISQPQKIHYFHPLLNIYFEIESISDGTQTLFDDTPAERGVVFQ